MNRWLSTIATITVLVTGYTTLAWATNGWKIWTAESARRLAVKEKPITLPDARLRDARGQSISLTAFDRPILLIDFIYTRCPSVCVAMGAEFRWWQSDLRTHGLDDDVQLLSLTFDSRNDGPQELAGHVLVEIPLLIAVGVILGARVASRLNTILVPINGGGIPGILLATATLAFWMIPRWLDASLADSTLAAIKYTSLVTLVGMPLAWSWARLHPIARGVVKIEFLTMLFRLGWLYLISPDRLCNNYLMTDQIWLGRGFLLVGLALSITWLIPVFFGSWAEGDDRNTSQLWIRSEFIGDEPRLEGYDDAANKIH